MPVWSLILNDSVTGLSDRWTQAKRHMWGIEETAWVLALFPRIRLKTWARMLQLSASQMLTTTVVPPWLILLFPQTRTLLWALPTRLLWWMALSAVATYLYTNLLVFVREAVLHRYILAHRKTMLPISRTRWAAMALSYLPLSFIGHLLFNTAATWAMLLHAVHHVHYGYVTAPKDLGMVLDSARSVVSSILSGLNSATGNAVGTSQSKNKFVFNVPEHEPMPRIESGGKLDASADAADATA